MQNFAQPTYTINVVYTTGDSVSVFSERQSSYRQEKVKGNKDEEKKEKNNLIAISGNASAVVCHQIEN